MCMPASSLQVEGRGNGIKTNVVNNVEIAKALERPPECECLRLPHTQHAHGACARLHIADDLGAASMHTADVLKFYGCELGAQTNNDKDTNND